MSGTLEALIGEVEGELKTFLTEETDRITAERKFLLDVLDGRTGGSGYNVENTSTDSTATLLTTLLQQYLTVEEA